jgi:hypothetical protein
MLKTVDWAAVLDRLNSKQVISNESMATIFARSLFKTLLLSLSDRKFTSLVLQRQVVAEVGFVMLEQSFSPESYRLQQP